MCKFSVHDLTLLVQKMRNLRQKQSERGYHFLPILLSLIAVYEMRKVVAVLM